jgi:hypothetical protein
VKQYITENRRGQEEKITPRIEKIPGVFSCLKGVSHELKQHKPNKAKAATAQRRA